MTRSDASKPIFVFIHSTGTTPLLWAGLPEAIASRGEIVAPANLGYPPNPEIPRGQKLTMRDDATEVLASVPDDGRDVHVFAHSYGGLVGLEILRRLGARVRSMFLYEPVLPGGLAKEADLDDETRREVDGFLQNPWFLDDETRGGTDAWLEVFIDFWNKPGSWARMPEEAKGAMRPFGWKMYQEVRSCFLDGELDGHALDDVETTLFVGGRSPRTSRAIVQRLAKRHPRARTVEVERAAHMSLLTSPGLIHPAMQEHVDRALG
ncbi:MAG TPA: alpha/beta hydrolase [Polyangiaceae bacterium]|nr:alpha/beta hydrolase [Polyangiaceae bacterium]